MPTRIVRGAAGMAEAVVQLRTGAVVGMPTETVYGLAADAMNVDAIRKVFETKGRPATNPLIVHVLDPEMAARFVKQWGARADRLAAAFWPGPLTLVLPKADVVPEIVTAGGATVALRAPAHPVARALIAAFGGPIAAPSANRSTGISPTTARAVVEELGGRIELVLDGGACEVGLESTVLDLTEHPAVILRPGHIGAEAIDAVLGEAVRVRTFEGDAQEISKSPGQMRRHYAPKTPLILAEASKLEALVSSSSVVLVFSVEPPPGVPGRRLPDSPETYARALYAALRWADAQGASEIIVEVPPTHVEWTAVWDRLRRAATRE
jgi:L-threonylcarbamoyladenylate synthase